MALNPSLLRMATPPDDSFDLHLPPGAKDLFTKRIEEVPVDRRRSWRFHKVAPGETLEDIARAYQAICTPDFFLFDRDRKLVYRGQLDDSRPNRGTADGRDLRAAIQSLLAGQPINPNQKPSTGCGLKWKQ